MCVTDEQLKCVNDLKIDQNQCLKKCDGIQVTAFAEHKIQQQNSRLISRLSESYNLYKEIYEFPENFRGMWKNVDLL